MSIQVHLEKFEGPLALLLYLIRKEEMDIYDIPIHKITEQYLEYIRMMKELNLELAGDFVAMAATLIHIKSKMLLPQYDEKGEEIESEDPRKELVERLLEYERYQQAGKNLYGRELLGREVFARGFKLEATSADPTIILDEGGLFAMIGLYRRVVKNVKKNVHVVMEKAQSLSSRILELRLRLTPGRRTRFDELITSDERGSKNKFVITFMSILELGRLGFVSLFQSETFGPIHIDTKKEIGRDVVSQVQELEAPEIQSLDLAVTPLLKADVEVEAQSASDDEIAEAERQMELAENLVQSEKLVEVLAEASTGAEVEAIDDTIDTTAAAETAIDTKSESNEVLIPEERVVEGTSVAETGEFTDPWDGGMGEPEPSPAL